MGWSGGTSSSEMLSASIELRISTVSYTGGGGGGGWAGGGGEGGGGGGVGGVEVEVEVEVKEKVNKRMAGVVMRSVRIRIDLRCIAPSCPVFSSSWTRCSGPTYGTRQVVANLPTVASLLETMESVRHCPRGPRHLTSQRCQCRFRRPRKDQTANMANNQSMVKKSWRLSTSPPPASRSSPLPPSSYPPTRHLGHHLSCACLLVLARFYSLACKNAARYFLCAA